MLEQAEKVSLRDSELSNRGMAVCETWPVQLVSN